MCYTIHMQKPKGNPALVKGMTSLNPAGRPKGSVNKYTALARELMSEKSGEIVQKVIDKAMDGDVHCLKMCMDRVLPVSYFEKDKNGSGRSSVSITITGVGGETTIVGEETGGEIYEHDE